MYGIKEVGKYNVDFEGLIYDGKIPYQMIIFEEFNGDTPIKGSRKTLYFRDDIGFKNEYIIPKFETESEVEKYLHYRNNTKLKLYNKLVVETVLK